MIKLLRIKMIKKNRNIFGLTQLATFVTPSEHIVTSLLVSAIYWLEAFGDKTLSGILTNHLVNTLCSNRNKGRVIVIQNKVDI